MYDVAGEIFSRPERNAVISWYRTSQKEKDKVRRSHFRALGPKEEERGLPFYPTPAKDERLRENRSTNRRVGRVLYEGLSIRVVRCDQMGRYLSWIGG